MLKIYSIVVMFLLSAAVITGCKDTVTGQDLDDRDKFIPDENVSYIQHVQPIFDVKCNYTGCHNSAEIAGGLSLASYQGTTSDLSIVFPGEPLNSRLYLVLSPGTTTPMPPPGFVPLTAKQTEAVRTWIEEGAKNN